jgi:hypothetical protein
MITPNETVLVCEALNYCSRHKPGLSREKRMALDKIFDKFASKAFEDLGLPPISDKMSAETAGAVAEARAKFMKGSG